jgi:hypothetical protein
MSNAYTRTIEVRRRGLIHLLSDDLNADLGSNKEPDAYKDVADLLELDPENKTELVSIAKHLPERIEPSTFSALAQSVFQEKSVEVQRLIAAGLVSDALSLVDTLEIVESSSTMAGVAALRQKALAQGDAIRKGLEDQSRLGGSAPSTRLVRAARAVCKAYPKNSAAAQQATALRDAYKSRLQVPVRERFYLRKLYYLAAVRYAKQQFGEARDLLEEILRRDAADEDANTLLDAMTRKGMTLGK